MADRGVGKLAPPTFVEMSFDDDSVRHQPKDSVLISGRLFHPVSDGLEFEGSAGTTDSAEGADLVDAKDTDVPQTEAGGSQKPGAPSPSAVQRRRQLKRALLSHTHEVHAEAEAAHHVERAPHEESGAHKSAGGESAAAPASPPAPRLDTAKCRHISANLPSRV